MKPTIFWYRIALLGYLLAWFAGSFITAVSVYSGAIARLMGGEFPVIEEYVYYALAGAIGGTLYALRLLHEYYDNLNERWIVWYLLRPINCAVAAVMTIILFNSGILLLTTGETMEARIGIAFLVGFGYGKLMDKLRMLTETLFNGGGRKDEQPAGPPSPGQPGKEA
ncbi:hypothetical protein ACVNS2_34635 [Paenibacillus caseinilyticus]|uniref:Uncharacterized protein n=1 Tax=Paenibacillus mucilaginosus K02 TaxID=997761 RepID=I0BU04_9BACL|nr:hypothetical protein [Paenibacillus mucilaginosus]AFH65851.1 hypothetical protein B2K_34980 [Paenibacillus mucilaginosus K02]